MARDSAYFLGEDFSIVDIAFFPWMQRSLSVLTVRQPLWAQTDEPLWRIQLWCSQVYRQFAFPETAEFERLSRWSVVHPREGSTHTVLCKHQYAAFISCPFTAAVLPHALVTPRVLPLYYPQYPAPSGFGARARSPPVRST
jgi:hypothetical protein